MKRRLMWNTHLPIGKRLLVFFRYLLQRWKGHINKPLFPDNEHLLFEELTLSVHTGTHIDAPLHYGSRSEDKPARTIDDYPLSMFYNDGVVLDMKDCKPNQEITPADVRRALENIDYTLKKDDILLIRTGWDKKRGTKEYLLHPGLNKEALDYILDCQVKIVGIDTYSLDRGLPGLLRDFYKNFDSRYLWPVHYHGRKREYLQLERLTNLDKIERNFGFKVICFPVKVERGSAAWSRAVVQL